jgi:hypothetical protein
MKHSIFSASGASRWSACPGSLALSRGAPRTSNPAAREGTAGHTLAERCLAVDALFPEPVDHEGEIIDVEGFEIEVTEDLALAVQSYVDYVRGFSGMRWTETTSNYASLLGVDTEEGFGTNDCIILDSTILHVIDLKLGRGFVDPVKNKQCILYAAGAVDAIEAVGEEITEIHIHIFQPRVTAKPIPYVLTRDELREQVELLRAAAQRAQEAMLTFTAESVKDWKWVKEYLHAGETQCKYCPAAAFCPQLRGYAEDLTGDDISYMADAGPGFLSEALSRVPLVERWVEAVQEAAMSRLSAGKPVDGYKLVLGREGNRKWSDPVKAEAAFEGLDAELTHTPPKLLSPAQMEKALKKAKLKCDLEPLVTRNPAKPTMTVDSDPRQAWSPKEAIAEEFGIVE